MSETLAATLTSNFNATLSNLGVVTPFALNVAPLITAQFTSGTGPNQVNQLYVAQPSLAVGASLSLNLHTMNGANDPMTNPYALVTVRMFVLLMLGNLSGGFTDADVLTIGGDGTANSWTSFLATNTSAFKLLEGTSLNPGFWPLVTGGTGLVVGAANNNIIKFTNSGANQFSFLIIVVGATS